MERKYEHTVEGQELQELDINLVSDSGALAEDYTLRELVRLYINGDSRTPDRGVLPFGSRPGGVVDDSRPTVQTADPTVKAVTVAPFRAMVGARDGAFATVAAGIAAQQDARSVLATGAAASVQTVSLGTDTLANDRWTLVYASLVIDQQEPNVSRFVKDPVSGVVTSTAIAVVRKCEITLGIVEGAEGASPTRPALPADSGSTYTIPLAYVYCAHPFTGASVVAASDIQDVAPCLPLSEATGASTVAPATGMWETAGPIVSSHTWDGTARPEPYLPATQIGGVERLIQLKWEGADRSIALSGDVVLDDSIDWRDRFFHSIVVAEAAGTHDFASSLPGGTAAVPYHSSNTLGTDMQIQCSHSFEAVSGSIAEVVSVAPANLSVMGASSSLVFYVHTGTGALRAVVSAADPAVKLWSWIRASGGFHA